jgi:esterase/lipase
MLREKILAEVTTPFMVHMGGREKEVCNKTIKSWYETTDIVDKTVVEYDEACHLLLQDKEYWPMVTKDVITWFDTHL